jgi:hypothetical protein
MIETLSSPAIRVLLVLGAMLLAYYKGRRMVLWGLLAFLIGPLAIIVLAFRRTLERKTYPWLQAYQRKVESRGIEKKFEDLGTTEDFLKEIENDKKDER